MKTIEEINQVKNKENRRKLYKKYLRIKRRERRKADFLKRKIIAEHGPDAVPTRPVRTIEGEREDEETAIHNIQEDDIMVEEAIDTFKDYYNKVRGYNIQEDDIMVEEAIDTFKDYYNK
ncbi:hypothetical protein FHG87_022462, partial [Trinorchestia longiramus]